MAQKLKDSQISWILSLDAKGVQSELVNISSKAKELTKENKDFEASIKSTTKEMDNQVKIMKKLREEGKYNTKAYNEAYAAYTQAKKKIEEYNDGIKGNNKLIAENKKKTDELVKTLKLEDMTMDQLKQQAKELAKQLNNTSKSADPAAWNALDKQLTAVNNRMLLLKAGSQEVTSTLKGGLMVMVGNLMTKGLTLFKNALVDAVDTIRSFEKANSFLASVLGENKNNIKDLSNSAIELGKNSKYTASQITELQTELAKLGFAQKEIKNSQKNVLDFATALDAELAPAAELTGAVIRAFGADTKESERYVSAMTLAANKSAISFEYLATAMPIVAPVAKAFNFSIEDTLALLGKLSDSGFDASMAATALRNILLNLADSNGKLAKSIGSPVRNLDEMMIGFQTLKDKGIDLATALDITDKRSVAAFQTFLNGTESILQLRDALQEAGGEAERVAKDQMNNLDGSVLSLKSSWEALMLSFSNSTGPMKKVVDGITAIIVGLTNMVELADKLQNRAAYKSFLGITKDNATDEFIGKLKTGVQGLTYDVLKGEDKKNFENTVKSNFGIYKEILNKEVEDLTKQQEEVQKKYDAVLEKNNKNLGGAGKFLPLYNIGLASDKWTIEKELEDITLKADVAKERLNALGDAYNEVLNKDKPSTATNNKLFTPLSDKEIRKEQRKQKEELDQLTESLETKHQERLAKIKKDYVSGDIKSEAKYNQELFAENQAYYMIQEEALKKHLQKLEEGPVKNESLISNINKRIGSLQTKRLDQEIKFRTALQKIILDADPLAKEEKEYKERLAALGLYGKDRKDLTADELQALELLEKQHQDNILKINQDTERKKKANTEKEFKENFAERKEELQQELNELMQIAASYSGPNGFDAEMAVHMQRLQMIREEMEARMAAGLETTKQLQELGCAEAQLTNSIQKENKRRSDIYNQYADNLGNALGEVLSGQKSAFEAFGSSMIDILFDTLSQIINAKIAEATAVAVAEQAKAAAIAAAMPDSVATFGASAAIRTAAIGAIIMGALTAAKTTLKGMISGRSGSSGSGSSENTGKRVVKGLADGGYNDPGTDGGYTGPGGRYEVAGVFSNGVQFHRGEYVVAQPEMRVPAVASMVRAIHAIKSQRSPSNPLPPGLADGGYNDNASTYTEPGVLDKTLNRLNNILHQLERNGVDLNYRKLETTQDTMNQVNKMSSR